MLAKLIICIDFFSFSVMNMLPSLYYYIISKQIKKAQTYDFY